jgi:hypothetical protein
MSRLGLVDDENGGNQWVDGKDADDGEASRFAAGSVNTGLVSEIAPSVMTTGSSATKPMANLDGYDSRIKKSKKNFSVLTTLDGGHGISSYVMEEEGEDTKPIPAPSGRGLIGAYGPVQENMDIASKNLERIQKRKTVTAKRSNEAFHLYANMLTSCMLPKDEFQIRREEYMSVLHLKMKARLGFYYLQRYLPMVPGAPVPPGLTKKSDDVPMLVSDDSEDSSSSGISQVIEYGSNPPSTPINCSITDSVFMDLAITGSLGLVPRHGHLTQRAPRRNQKSPDHYTVLMNRRSGVPLAVCALKSPNELPIVRIYATKQRVNGQRPAASTKQLGLDWACNLPLYAWAEIVTEGLFPDPVRFSIYMASGSEGRFSATPSYRAAFLADGAPSIKVFGRTDKEQQGTGCALISIDAGDDEEDGDLSFHIDVSQGIDPALLICFTAVVDEVMEKSMRLQCRYHSRRRQRRVQSRSNGYHQ